MTAKTPSATRPSAAADAAAGDLPAARRVLALAGDGLRALGDGLGQFQVRGVIVRDDLLQFGRGAVTHEHRLAPPLYPD